VNIFHAGFKLFVRLATNEPKLIAPVSIPLLYNQCVLKVPPQVDRRSWYCDSYSAQALTRAGMRCLAVFLLFTNNISQNIDMCALSPLRDFNRSASITSSTSTSSLESDDSLDDENEYDDCLEPTKPLLYDREVGRLIRRSLINKVGR